MSDIVISGYYGLGNSGDEALLKSMVDDLKSIDPDITITALSGNAKLTQRMYGIKTVNRFNPFAIYREFRKARLLLSGGGTLIQDATSTKSLLYYLSIIAFAKKMGMKVMLYANGMGPIRESNVKRVQKVLNKVELITLRENVSLEEIKRCDVSVPKVVVTADPAFNLTAAQCERADKILASFSIEPGQKLVAVSVRESKGMPENFENEMAMALDEVAKKGYLPLFIPMQVKNDFEISMRIAGKMKEKSRVIDAELQISDMLAIIGRCSIACGMRLHMLIFASVMNVPMAGVAYDPKIRGFMDYMSQTSYVELNDFNAQGFSKMAVDCLENREKLQDELAKNSDLLRTKAKQNAILAIDLLKK